MATSNQDEREHLRQNVCIFAENNIAFIKTTLTKHLGIIVNIVNCKYNQDSSKINIPFEENDQYTSQEHRQETPT